MYANQKRKKEELLSIEILSINYTLSQEHGQASNINFVFEIFFL